VSKIFLLFIERKTRQINIKLHIEACSNAQIDYWYLLSAEYTLLKIFLEFVLFFGDDVVKRFYAYTTDFSVIIRPLWDPNVSFQSIQIKSVIKILFYIIWSLSKASA